MEPADALAAAAGVAVDVADAEAKNIFMYIPEEKDLHVPDYFLLQLHMTNRCNLRCIHCYQEDYEGDEPDLKTLLNIFSQTKELISCFKNHEKKKTYRSHITITGGEPFLRNDLFELIEEISAHKDLFTFSILTNGTLLTPENTKILKTFSPLYIQLSVEGNRTIHDSIRGMGNYQACVSAIKMLKKTGIPVSVSFTAHKKNFVHFKDVVDACTRLKVSRIWSDRFVPLRTYPGQSDLVLGKEKTKAFFEIMYREKRKANRSRFKKSKVSMHRALQFLVGGGRPYSCKAGDSLITVMPNGDVYPCRRMPIPVGNIFKDHLSKIYFTSSLLKKLRDKTIHPSECKTCFYVNQCRGGLKCLAYAVNGDPFTIDPDCVEPTLKKMMTSPQS